MPTDLRSGLRRLADASGPASPPGDLWSRGVRRRRRVRATSALATGAVVLAAVLAGTAGWDGLVTDGAQPVADPAVPAIPDRLEPPGQWLPSVVEDGPIGPLAAIVGAERGSFWSLSTSTTTVGVSATTGEYRFLDLPNAFDDVSGLDATPPELSPDGRSVAYWTAQEGRPDRVGGFAVYDTVTGKVTSRSVPSELGLGPDALDWVDAETVLMAFGEVTERRGDGTTVSDIRDRLWTPDAGRLVESEPASSFFQAWPVPEGYAVAPSSRRIVTHSEETGRRIGVIRVTGDEGLRSLTVDPTGTTAAGFVERSSGPMELWVGDLETRDDEGRAAMRELPTDLRLVRPALGWQDATHVVVRASDADDVTGAYAVDVRTGEHTLVVREGPGNYQDYPAYAAALWQVPTVERPRPDRVVDPRLRAAGAGVAALALAGGLLVVRRRRARA